MAQLLRDRTPRASVLRTLLDAPSPVLALGAYDALSARLAEQAGASAIYMTGYGVTASRLGRPDVGLLSMSEMAAAAKAICDAVDVPVVADADTGYGNAINVIRTVQEYESAGVAAIQLEDQTFPKKCGHMEHKSVVAAEEMARKIEAAVAARHGDDLTIIARTDAVATDGYDEALRRARMYADAGADVLFVEAPGDREQIERIPADLAGHRLLFNWVEGGKTPEVSLDRLAEIGYDLVILPISGLLAATAAMQDAYASIIARHKPEVPGIDFAGFCDVIGLDEVTELNARFGTP
jgi:2,3-dimethylmalate lyase